MWFLALFVLNLQAAYQVAMFIDPTLPAAWEIGRIAEVLLRVVGWG
ncbi:MAG: hypothetical protein MR711_06870 [Selenomonas sp.]|nr:hypothetical protein [Selenomonas sp.]